MELLLNPNIAYLLLTAGLLVMVLAVFSPGTGLLEVGALFLLFGAGYGVYNLPVNWWAFAVLVVGFVPFILAVRKSGRMVYLVISLLALVVGSAFLFQSEGGLPAVNPILAAVVSVLTVGYLWIGVRKALEAEKLRPAHSLEGLIGALGEAKTDVHDEGSVQVSSELWSARSQQLIPAGSPVRVVRRDGFILEVEPVK